MKTLEEIANEHERHVYGSCDNCKKKFKADDKFIEIKKFVCGSSQGYPATYHTGEETRFCIDCGVKYNLYL